MVFDRPMHYQTDQRHTMNNDKIDLRKIGGKRVTCPFKMIVANPDPFRMNTDSFTGTVVFNVRGGCFFFDNSVLSQAASRIFNGKPVALLDTLDLQTPEHTCSMRKIKIRMSREKELSGRQGIVFKFFQTTEAHMDLLNHLINLLPHVETDSAVVQPPLKKAG